MEKGRSCSVCGDKASGKHYGVSSCDGCRGFFKRSIRRNLEYACKEGGNCLIDVTRRNQCQACRFAKCLRVNMKRDAVQHERVPRTNVSTLEDFSRLPMSSVTWNLSIIPRNMMFHSDFLSPRIPSIDSQNITEFSSRIATAMSSNNSLETCYYGNENEVTSSEEIRDQFIEKNTVTTPFSINYILTEEINESALKLLIFTIKWTKSIPSFLQLTEQDKKNLLIETWSELFIINTIQWAFSVNNNFINYNRFSQDIKLINLKKKLEDITIRFHSLQVDYTEFACLKALILFKSDAENLRDRLHVEILQDQTQIMLCEYCASKQNIRFGKLLLLLKSIGYFENHIIEKLFFEKIVRQGNSIENVIIQILKQ